MAYMTTNYQIAAGNNNAGGLALVTSLTDANSIALQEPRGITDQSRGLRVRRANRTVARQGLSWVRWFSPVLLAQYEYLKDNFEGLVTIKIAFHSETFANYHAVLTLLDFHELDTVVFAGITGDPNFVGPGKQLVWEFTAVEAI